MISLKNRSLFIQSSDNRFWLRVFRRKGSYFSLTNFAPSAYPHFVDRFEKLVKLQKLSNYSETNMGVLIFNVSKGLPVADIQILLSDLSSLSPVDLIHIPHETEKLDAN